MKITLFMCAGAIMVATGKKNISEMAGIGKQIPITMLAFSITAMGMCGIPPACGFISKIYLCFGAWALQPPYGLIFLAVILVSSLLDVIYFFPIIYTAFFRELPEGGGSEEGEIKEAPIFMVVPLSITAIFSIIFFIHPNTMFVFDLVKTAVASLGL
jgi:formate hydrogenlyase subunit 3/multisubunit Na+/H+ antiporter MnhD subunit